MLVTRSRTERPRDLYCSLALLLGTVCVGWAGGWEADTLVSVESLVKYRSDHLECLTWARDPGQGQCLAGSLTGAVASQKVPEAPKGTLSPVGNRVPSASAQGCLTVRQTCQAGAKAGTSDPAPASGSGVAQRLKGTPGITG